MQLKLVSVLSLSEWLTETGLYFDTLCVDPFL